MILNYATIYAEFLDHFLDVIQNEEQRNAATLFSGFLRATKLTDTIANLSADQTYIPLSAVLKAGLVDCDLCFMISTGSQDAIRKVSSIGFFFDKARLQAALTSLGIHKEKLNQVQQLVLVTACQEAKNRVLCGDFKRFVGNIRDEDIDLELQVTQMMQLLDSMAFGSSIQAIQFIPGTTELLPESIAQIERRRNDCLEMAKENLGALISESQLNPVITVMTPLMLPSKIRIDIFNELIPSLSINPEVLSAEQCRMRDAKLQLLKLYCTIFSMILHEPLNSKSLWFYSGQQILLADKNTVTMPYIISNILKIIEDTVAQKHKADYILALNTIQATAKHHTQDWLTWVYEILPLFKSSPCAIEFLNKVLQIDVSDFHAPQTETKREAPSSATPISDSYLTQTIHLFFPKSAGQQQTGNSVEYKL